MHGPRLRNILHAALNLAILDGGFVIAIQIIDFLLHYFGASLFGAGQSIEGFNRSHLIAALLGILNLAAIITRSTGLTRGVRLGWGVCYQHAIRCWPLLILLYTIGDLIQLSLRFPIVTALNAYGLSMEQFSRIFMLLALILIPYGLLACAFVVDRAQNPLNAIRSTLNLIKHKLNFSLLLSLSMLYSMPLCFSSLLAHTNFAAYLGLISSIWLLFCHLVTLIIYVSSIEPVEKPNPKTEKNIKIMIA